MRPFLFILSLLLCGLTSQANAQAHRLYAVIFEATLGADNRVNTLKVSKVVDPASGTTDPVELAIPDGYVTAAREYLRGRTYPPQQASFFTWLYYDPDQPTRADLDTHG